MFFFFFQLVYVHQNVFHLFQDRKQRRGLKRQVSADLREVGRHSGFDHVKQKGRLFCC